MTFFIEILRKEEKCNVSTQLTEGKKTFKELAEWFGISYGAFRNSKQKKLGELSKFAEYHLDLKGKVIIDKVINPDYSKADNKLRVEERFVPTWSESGLDSCKRVAEVIFIDLSESYEDFNLKLSSVYNYVIIARNKLFGRPFISEGELGSCEYVWCKKTKEGYSFLTEEEQAIKEKLLKKYYGNTTEKQLIVKKMVDDGELKETEAFDYLNTITGMTTDSYKMFLSELNAEIGGYVVKGTLIKMKDESAF